VALPRGQVSVVFTIINSAFDASVALEIVGLEGADPAWFTVQPSQQTIPGQRSGFFTVTVDAAAAISSGLIGPRFLAKTPALFSAPIPLDGGIIPTSYVLSEAVLLTTHVTP
jgi:hypothetical protein